MKKILALCLLVVVAASFTVALVPVSAQDAPIAVFGAYATPIEEPWDGVIHQALLAAQKLKPSALKKIIVANRGGSFTSLRIGVITANALGYALKIPVLAEWPGPKKAKKFAGRSLVEPIYDREPEIGPPKKLLV